MTAITPNNDQIIALVTGANRGLGKRFADGVGGARSQGLRSRTTAGNGRCPRGDTRRSLTSPIPSRCGAPHEVASDVNVVVNNAGVSTQSDLLSGAMDDIRLEMETHYFGTLQVTRAFVPVIERNGGGAILNVLSVLSWLHAAKFGAYAAAKAAGWAMTDALREELAPRGIHVAALHVGFMDTDMAEFVPADQKADPAGVAAQALDGLFAGEPEILADELTRTVRAQLSQPPQVATL